MDRISQSISEFWDEAVSDYDKHMLQTGHYAAQESLLSIFHDYLESPVLDLAGGTGYLSGLLLEQGFDVTLNDFSREMIGFCRTRLHAFGNISFSEQNAEAISTEKMFSTLICCNAFYYLQDMSAALSNWRKILKPRGKLVIMEEYPFMKPESHEMAPRQRRLMELVRPISPEAIKEYFKGDTLEAEAKASIDGKHDLFGFVFSFSRPI